MFSKISYNIEYIILDPLKVTPVLDYTINKM